MPWLASRHEAGTLQDKRCFQESSLPDQPQFLVISLLGENRPDILHGLARVVRDSGCNLDESRMTLLGNDFAMLVLASGNWNSIARLETGVTRFAETLQLQCNCHRTESRAPRGDLIPYVVDVVCLDQPGIVYSLADFFRTRDIHVAELTTRTYAATHTGAPMFALTMAISVPASMHIGMLREEFTDFCDHLNLDAVLEPLKS